MKSAVQAIANISLILLMNHIITELKLIPKVRTKRCPSESDCFQMLRTCSLWINWGIGSFTRSWRPRKPSGGPGSTGSWEVCRPTRDHKGSNLGEAITPVNSPGYQSEFGSPTISLVSLGGNRCLFMSSPRKSHVTSALPPKGDRVSFLRCTCHWPPSFWITWILLPKAFGNLT